MFKIGDVIKRRNKENYSHANIYSGSFVVSGITDKDYILLQSNFYGNMNIEVVNKLFIIDDEPRGYIINIKDHVLNNLV